MASVYQETNKIIQTQKLFQPLGIEPATSQMGRHFCSSLAKEMPPS